MSGMSSSPADPVLVVDGVSKEYGVAGRRIAGHRPVLRAVEGASFTLGVGETLGIVGESGCGKSTLARLLVGLERPTRGTVQIFGHQFARLSRTESRQLRRSIQLVMQDPYTSLDPRMTAGQIVTEPLQVHRDVVARPDRDRYVGELFEMVGLNPDHRNRYPHQFSGGQRQRIGIARALALHPKILVCDEPVSALDVSVQAQVLNLLSQLQVELGLSYIFIGHDLSVVRHISDRLLVLYLGKVVEYGTAAGIYGRPAHPYTEALLSAIPGKRGGSNGRIVLPGDPPSPTSRPTGCVFRTRCWKASAICEEVDPPLIELHRGGQEVACHFPNN
ncbi:ABC transporter ATP-binding protein [Phytohabitans kaempferiae]|uniref:ABC transporter ATP-binding protein n=1 Tax=Phytohabitans kaempferiae TaxID=1620943 RepID=A0ABV6MHQ1_9ACTN